MNIIFGLVKEPRVFFPDLRLSHRDNVDLSGHFLHVLAFKCTNLSYFVEFFLEGHLVGRTFLTFPLPQFTVSSRLSSTASHTMLTVYLLQNQSCLSWP